VSQIGWHWFTGMAARRPVCLVTHVRNRAAIEAAPDKPVGARVIYIDTEWLAGPLYRAAKALFPRSEHAVFMLSQLDWFAFDAVALRQLRRELARGAPWRLLHLVTPVTLSAMSRLHRLGLPLLRGPLNCGLTVPAGFAALMRDDGMGLSRLRVLPRLLERLLGSLRQSRVVLVATAATRAAVPAAAQARCQVMLENAVDPRRFAPGPGPDAPALASAVGAARPLRVSFVGRLVPVKALPLLLQAMARLRGEGRPVLLDVVGDGPMAAPWRAEAAALALGDAVRWHGALGADAVAAVMRGSHVFCLPSVRESGGAVLLEAMACGRPVIGMDFGGPAEIVDADVGWIVPVSDPETAVAGLADALRQAFDQPVDAARRGHRGRTRVLAHHTWAARMDAAERLYAEVLADAAVPPDAAARRLSAASGARLPWRSAPAPAAPRR
jgi:glycosyltransferase involved in cell wall biosynthesis